MPPLSGLPGFSGVRVAKPEDGAVCSYAAGASSRVCASWIADASTMDMHSPASLIPSRFAWATILAAKSRAVAAGVAISSLSGSASQASSANEMGRCRPSSSAGLR